MQAVFHGPRGLGKTSLLRDAQEHAEELGFVTAWIACHSNAPFLPDLADRTAHTLHRAEVISLKQRRQWQLRLDRVGVELGIPSVVKVSAEASVDNVSTQGGAHVSALEDLLHEAGTQVRARGGAGLLVFIDELHAAGTADLAVMLNALQNLSGRRDENPLAVIAAGLPSTPEALVRAATFGERTAFHPLPPLSTQASRAAVTTPAGLLDVRWDDAALRAVTDQAQGFPYLIQMIAHATWEAGPELTAGAVIDTDRVNAGQKVVTDQLTAMHRARWTASTALEQQILTVMAYADSDRVARSAIATALDRPSAALSMPRARLIDKGIIEPAGHGALRFTMPAFDQYIRDIAQIDPK